MRAGTFFYIVCSSIVVIAIVAGFVWLLGLPEPKYEKAFGYYKLSGIQVSNGDYTTFVYSAIYINKRVE